MRRLVNFFYKGSDTEGEGNTCKKIPEVVLHKSLYRGKCDETRGRTRDFLYLSWELICDI